MPIRITAVDTTTGETRESVVRDGDYVVIAVSPCVAELVDRAQGGRVDTLRVHGRIPQDGDQLWRPES